MRRLALVALVACGHPPRASDGGLPREPALPRLLPPAPIDPRVPGAAYLQSIALQLQPGWGQFLDDCRLRLPRAHALNTMTLAATAILAIDEHGRVTTTGLETSGNHDFDRAVRDAIVDAAPLPPPPRELLSDDDRVHVRWLFARDRRQAGPATAVMFPVALPLTEVVKQRIERREIARAAQRIIGAHDDAQARAQAIREVAIAALREALESSDTRVQLRALEAIVRAPGVATLMPAVRAKLGVADRAVRLAAMHAGGRSPEAQDSLLAQLRLDLVSDPEAALVEVALLHPDAAAEVVRAFADMTPEPSPQVLPAFDVLPVAEFRRRLGKLWQRGDARVRAGVCAAIARHFGHPAEPDAELVALVERGLRERDAVVRASCVGGAVQLDQVPAAIAQRIRELATDRDASVRAQAVAATVSLDRVRFVHAATDRATEVRAVYARALAAADPAHAEPELEILIDDRDGDVRAAAWSTYAHLATRPPDRPRFAERAIHDSAPQVRAAAVPAVLDEELLAHVAAGDEDPAVRTAALVELAQRQRGALLDPLLERLAAAPPASVDRVRIALACLLAL